MSFAYKFDGEDVPSRIYSGNFDRNMLELVGCIFSDREYDWTRTRYRNEQFVCITPIPTEEPTYVPTDEDILAQQKAEARWKLQELDTKSIRALREIALGQADSVTYLQQYDSLAAEYRALLAQEIPLPEDTLVGGNDA